jgi:hypothetical protein
VKLACGHYFDHVSPATDQTPGDAPKLVTPKRAEEMRQGLEAAWAIDPVESPGEAPHGRVPADRMAGAPPETGQAA